MVSRLSVSKSSTNRVRSGRERLLAAQVMLSCGLRNLLNDVADAAGETVPEARGVYNNQENTLREC